ncbi:MAG TPA: TolC family protein [Burkholderiales bacterium]|jgi:cobalt-zinc-cadmium efflux system outer membrane protein|nr:TolC family protein [Burkholderiales bacterium]
MIQRLVLVFFAFASTALQARDLSLAEAERLLAERNRELLAARRAVESAGAQRISAAARPNPTLSLNTSSISSSPGTGAGPLNQKRIDTVLRLDQPFERGGKRELRMDAAEGLERAARGDSLDVLRTQLAQLRGAYYDLKQAEERVRILEDNSQLFARTFSAAQTRVKAGDLAPAEAAKVQVDYERAQNDARSTLAELTRARLALAYLIGETGAAADLHASDPWPERYRPDEPAIARAIEQSTEARPDVVAAKARVAAAEKLRDLARSQRTRDVTIGAQYERFPGTVPADSIGIGFSVPLFLGNDFSGDIQRAEVDRYAALDALERARAVASSEVRRAASDLNAAVERLERFDGSLLAAADRSAQAAEFAFQRGATSVLEVLDARRTRRAVQLEALAARTDYAKALAAWRASLTTAEAMEAK